MRSSRNLWVLTVFVPSGAASFFGDAFEAESLAVSVFAPPRQPRAQIKILFPSKPDPMIITAKLALLSSVAGLKPPKPVLRPLPPLNWLKKVAGDFPPLKIGAWTIHGALHKNKVRNRKNALQIDATSAFGTGEHPTTRGCLLMLDKTLKKGFMPKRMADIGCGSGILAMACAQKTGCKAYGVDLDKGSVKIAKENAAINGLKGLARFVQGDGYKARLIAAHEPYDLIMSNIFAKPLCAMAKDLKNNLAQEGIAILSGILTSQAKDVIAAHRKQRLVLKEHMKIGEWSILAFGRPRKA